MSLRSIQQTAAGVAAFFGIFAWYDVAADAARGAMIPKDAALALPGAQMALLLPEWLWLVGAAALGLAPLIALLSVRHSCRATRAGDASKLDHWRRLTWGSGIVETAGCLLFVLLGVMTFLPSAVALLIVGVAELATILQDLEQRAPNHAPRRATT